MFKKEEVEIISPADVIIGNKRAPVTITQFIDYESEDCEKADAVTKAIMKTFGDKVNFNFRHFPMTIIHQKAHKAAEAAIAALQEGRFYEMHEILLQNRRHLGTVSLKSYAREAGVKAKSLLNDLINGKYGWYVQDDLKYGIDLGVTEAPAFLINGVLYKGHINSHALIEAVKAALRKKKLKKAA
jgi:protein-disulfide isomerase